MKIAIAGLGLIGGSIAKAIRENNVGEVIGIDTDKNVLHKAQNDLVINKAIETWDLEKIETLDADIVFICTPVKCAVSIYKSIIRKIKKGTVVTDVLSVKGDIVNYFIKNTPDGVYFISGHPMGGTEKSGYENSTSKILDKCTYMILPPKNTPIHVIKTFKDVIEKIGSIPIIMDIDDHDEILSIISHIPHVLSASLLHLAKNYTKSDLKRLIAGSFKDMTRVSSSMPDMWANISLINKNEVIKNLNEYISQIDYFKSLLIENNYDEIKKYFDEAKQYRESERYADKAL